MTPRVRCFGPDLTHRRLGGSKRGVKEKKKQKGVFISGNSSAILDPTDQGFSLGDQTSDCANRRNQDGVGRRERQRANRRKAIIAARCTREDAKSSTQRMMKLGRGRQSNRQERRRRYRHAKKQSEECQRLLSKISAQVNPTGWDRQDQDNAIQDQ